MKRLLPKAVWIFVGDGGAKLFGFIATIYLARTLGVEQFGQLAFALSVLGICAWFTDMGINTVATRSVAAENKESTYFPSDFLWLKLVLTMLTIIVSSVALWFIFIEQPTIRALCLLFLLSLIPHALQIEWYYRGVQKFEWVTLGKWIQGAVYVTGLILIVTADDLLTVPVIYALSIFAGALSMIIVYGNLQDLFKLPDVNNWSIIFKSGAKVGVGSFLAQSVILFPYIILAVIFSDRIVGLYGAAFKVILVVMLADRVFTTLLLPNLSEKWTDKPEAMTNSLNTLSKWMLTAGFSASVILWFNAEFIITTLFSAEYSEAAQMLALLSFFIPATFLNSVFMYGLISSGDDNRFLSATLYGGILSLIIMTLGALSENIAVFVLSVVISEITIALFVYMKFNGLLKIDVIKPVLIITSAFAVSLILAGYIPLTAPIVSIISLIFFGILLIVTKGINAEDYRWLKRQITS